MMGKKLIAGLCAILLLVSSFSAAAASYQHGDKVKVTVSESWAFHGGRAPGETSTSNGGNRENHYNNRLYWFEGYSVDILQMDGSKYARSTTAKRTFTAYTNGQTTAQATENSMWILPGMGT